MFPPKLKGGREDSLHEQRSQTVFGENVIFGGSVYSLDLSPALGLQ